MAKQTLEEKSLEVFKAGNLSKQALSTILSRVNNDKHPILNIDDEITLDENHVEQGRAWLCNLAWTPTGKARKNDPFGNYELEILKTFDTITLSDFYMYPGYGYSRHYGPVYTVKGKNGDSFQYYIQAGKIEFL